MSGSADRRSFFRDLIRGAAQTAGELSATLRDAPAAFEEAALGGSHLGGEYRQETRAARPARRLASADELRMLCAEVGLGALADEATALATAGFRLTAGGGGASRLGGLPDVPFGFEWPTAGDEELVCVASLRLDELPETALPRTGTLLVFAALPAVDGGACRVVHVAGPVARAVRDDPLRALPVVASAELTLPAAPLDGVDIEAWTELRERLAAIQGVELEELSVGYVALHRLLGHPESLDPGLAHEAGAPEAVLLFQLSGDDRLGIALGYERLTIWIRGDDLRAGDFDRVRGFLR